MSFGISLGPTRFGDWVEVKVLDSVRRNIASVALFRCDRSSSEDLLSAGKVLVIGCSHQEGRGKSVSQDHVSILIQQNPRTNKYYTSVRDQASLKGATIWLPDGITWSSRRATAQDIPHIRRYPLLQKSFMTMMNFYMTTIFTR